LAVEAKDLDALAATLREDVVFHTPLRLNRSRESIRLWVP
jgi:hypothetical protein